MSRGEGRTASGVAWWAQGPADAPPLVVCHGMALDHADLGALLEPLTRDWRLILWDMPGHGASAALPSRCTLAAMTDALQEVVDAATMDRPVLLGFSFGGMVAQDWLRRGRCDARALIAFGCYAPFQVAAPLPLVAVESLLIAPMTERPWPEVRAAFAKACTPHPEAQARLHAPIDRLGPSGLAAMTRALFEAFTPDPDFRLNLPTLVLRGADDANGAPLTASAAALLAAADNALEVVIRGAGHCAYLDQPEATLAAISAFLD